MNDTIQKLEDAMADVDRRIEIFRRDHMGTFNGRVAYRCSTWDERAKLDREFRELQRERDRIHAEFTRTLQENAAAKVSI